MLLTCYFELFFLLTRFVLFMIFFIFRSQQFVNLSRRGWLKINARWLKIYARDMMFTNCVYI